MEDRRAKILLKETNGIFDEYEGGITGIFNAMDENGKEMCLELLEFMANKKIDCYIGKGGVPVFYVGHNLNSEQLTKEQLFEMFL